MSDEEEGEEEEVGRGEEVKAKKASGACQRHHARVEGNERAPVVPRREAASA